MWAFPPTYLSGVEWRPGVPLVDGWLKLDIAAVYLVSTLAVTATGAIVLSAAKELEASRAARCGASRRVDRGAAAG